VESTLIKLFFGGERGYIIVSWGKNIADHAAKIQKRNELFRAELPRLWAARTLLITRKYCTRVGWVDLVLLDGNPLDDIHNTRKINGVLVKRKWFD
jgi:hypothetical protein